MVFNNDVRKIVAGSKINFKKTKERNKMAKSVG